MTSESYYNAHCYTYSHVYNNLIHDAQRYDPPGGAFLYSDSASARVTFERNIMYGTGGIGLKHHCGKDNMSVNNVVHRYYTICLLYTSPSPRD